MNMESTCVQLNDLPDEILVIIFRKLNNLSLLYSLLGMNKRLDQVLHDKIFTNTLTLFKYDFCDHISLLPNGVMDRICSEILPRIEYQIKWFNLEASSMERILLSGNYSNLSGLGIYNITEENVLYLSRNKTSLTHIFENQISSLFIQSTKKFPLYDGDVLIFTNIFTIFPKLKRLNYHPPNIGAQYISFRNRPTSIFSSTLLELHIKVLSLRDCLYFLDKCFNQLRIFNVTIIASIALNSVISQEKLLNLRCFSLSCTLTIYFYDAMIIPLLHRMSNLEVLHLYFTCYREQSFIDGNNLKTNIINHLPQLKTFKFNICSFIENSNQMNLLSNENIQKTFEQFTNNQIISCVDYFPEKNLSQCHIYTYPYTLTSYEHITNHFPGGLFPYVHQISLFDERPFEHEFFLRIRKSFPLLKDLTVTNRKGQEHQKLTNIDRIHYHHMTCLNLTNAHDDYIEEFLLDSKTSLPFNLKFLVDYQPIRRVTHDFQRIETRINCSKINCVYIDHHEQFSKDFRNYFLTINRM